MPTPASVLCLGEVLIDIIVSDGATSLEDATSFLARPGGAPANVAVALAKLGLPSAFCGAVGEDPFGTRLLRVLKANKVDTDDLLTVPGENTTLAFAWKDQSGDGHFRILRMADTHLSVDQVERSGISERAAIIVGSVALTDAGSRLAIWKAVEIARGADVPVFFDVNIRPSLWESVEQAQEACQSVLDGSTLVKLSLEDAAFLLGTNDPDVIFSCRFAGDPYVLVTGGAQGAWFRNDSGMIEHVASYPIVPVEPTGAGDAFTAAIVSRVLTHRRAPDREDLAFASAAGAITATRVGAIESLPTMAEIERFISDR